MKKADPSPIEQWAGALESLSKRLHAHAKAILTAGDDPFAQREQFERTAKTLTDIDVDRLRGPADVRNAVETQCIEATAEFWQEFSVSATRAGWEMHGTTDRRLVSRAFFVELKNDGVTIEAVSGRHSPHVPKLIHLLKPLVESLVVDKSVVQRFVDILAQAYDVLGGRGDIGIEATFRQYVLLVQSPGFWATVQPEKFEAVLRPVFRHRLSAVLAGNIVPSDGRELRLTPTVNRKDFWELFSPAEGRVVQVGRLAFASK